MLIRRAQVKDIPRLIDLLKQVGQVHHDLRPDIFRSGAQKYDAAELETMLAGEEYVIFVAEVESFVAGYCFCMVKETAGSNVLEARKDFYIDDLCVEEGYRGHGVAKPLYDAACREAKALGCDFLTLNVWGGNDRALAFYEKCGLRMRNMHLELPLEDTGC